MITITHKIPFRETCLLECQQGMSTIPREGQSSFIWQNRKTMSLAAWDIILYIQYTDSLTWVVWSQHSTLTLEEKASVRTSNIFFHTVHFWPKIHTKKLMRIVISFSFLNCHCSFLCNCLVARGVCLSLSVYIGLHHDAYLCRAKINYFP